MKPALCPGFLEVSNFPLHSHVSPYCRRRQLSVARQVGEGEKLHLERDLLSCLVQAVSRCGSDPNSARAAFSSIDCAGKNRQMCEKMKEERTGLSNRALILIVSRYSISISSPAAGRVHESLNMYDVYVSHVFVQITM